MKDWIDWEIKPMGAVWDAIAGRVWQDGTADRPTQGG